MTSTMRIRREFHYSGDLPHSCCLAFPNNLMPLRPYISVPHPHSSYMPVKMIASEMPFDHSSIAVSPDGRMLAALGSDAESVMIFDSAKLDPLVKLVRPSGLAKSSPAKVSSLSSSSSSLLNRSGMNLSSRTPTKGAGREEAGAVQFRQITFSADSTEVFVSAGVKSTREGGAPSYRLMRFDISTGKLVRDVRNQHYSPIDALALSPLGGVSCFSFPFWCHSSQPLISLHFISFISYHFIPSLCISSHLNLASFYPMSS